VLFGLFCVLFYVLFGRKGGDSVLRARCMRMLSYVSVETGCLAGRIHASLCSCVLQTVQK
jgi:hypothetical protein